ncbi:MAG: 30S ribosomal protein S9 [Candidatus Nanoarchaeia archaeon]
MAKVVHVSGKRKTAIARATIKEGAGIIRINKIPLEVYNQEVARMRIREPLLIAGELASKINANINVKGGGWHSQAEAARQALAKGMVRFFESKDLEKAFLDYDRTLLVADIRRKEPKKFGRHSRARARRQTSYR